ncbi:MAG: cell division protein FtsQ [Patescibacteria group bacterium]|nr:cell division protein FtsQ [Patescibacteria group bacterium]
MSEQRVVKLREKINSNSTGTSAPKSKKPQFNLKKLIRPIIIVVLVLIVLYAVLASSLFKINKIEIVGNQTIDSEDVKSQVSAIITGSSISQNIIFVPSSDIEKQLKKDNYQVADVKISKIPFSTIKVTITEQKPSILWKSGNNLSIITENGRGFIGEPNDELKSNLPTVEDLSNLPVKEGDKVVSQEFVKFVNDMYTTLPQNGVEIVGAQIEETTTEITVITKDGYRIRFDTTRPFSEQLSDLNAVLDSLKQQGKKPTQYIDLRINAKVFYK